MRAADNEQRSLFALCHPMVQLAFFVVVLGATMLSNIPPLLLLSWLLALGSLRALLGAMAQWRMLWASGAAAMLICIINGLFTHNGATVLLYLNGNRITVEGFFYGFWSGALLAAVMVWLRCMTAIMTSDRLIYLFGRAMPACGLLIAMTIRWLPLLRARAKQICAGQRGMGKTAQLSRLGRLRQRAKEASILVAWSLESCIQMSDSMAARGYGLSGRTQFHLFRWTRRDKLLLLWFMLAGAVLLVEVLRGSTQMSFYPRPVWPKWSTQLLCLVAFTAAAAVPLLVHFQGERICKQYGWNT